MTCQREGCLNPVKGPRSRFCSGACKVAAHRNKRKGIKTMPKRPATRLAAGQMVSIDKDGFITPDPKGMFKIHSAVTSVTPEPLQPLQPTVSTFRNVLAPPTTPQIPAPGSIGIPKSKPISLKPMMMAVSEKTKAILDRSHAPGCPCWTCKGVPKIK